MSSLPKLFLGSSREADKAGLLTKLVHALNGGLNADGQSIEIVPWNASPWKNLSAAVATLVESLVDYSYAVFILSADDELSMRGKKHFAARDNVVFEFGLFLAHLGPERTFLVGPENADAVVPVSQLSTSTRRSTTPFQLRPLRILTDLGTVYREGHYTITANADGSFGVDFEVNGVVRLSRQLRIGRRTWMSRVPRRRSWNDCRRPRQKSAGPARGTRITAASSSPDSAISPR